MKYDVWITVTQTLAERRVEAKSKKEAIAKALPKFNKVDLSLYEEIHVVEVDEDD